MAPLLPSPLRSARPEVSVVVSTYERPVRLAQLLAGLRAQTLPRRRFEVVIVDNGSGPATAEVLDAELAAGALALRVVRHERTLGPAGGRNAGWRAARAELVAFTDDDCVPAPGWLAALLAAAPRGEDGLVQGRTEPSPAELPGASPLTSRTVRVTELSPAFETCNILYPRRLLEALGGFDEGFGLRPAGEDTELAWRAIGQGSEVTFAPEALVHHAVVRLGAFGMLRDATRWGACARMLAREPGSRAVLFHGLFWNVWHFLLVRTVLAQAGPRWLRRLVWQRHSRALRARARELGSGPWAIPYLLVYDTVETAAMIRGAVRSRTPVI